MNSEALRFDRFGGGQLVVPFERIDFITNAYQTKDEGTTAERVEIVPNVVIVALVNGREFSVNGTMADIWEVVESL